MAEPIDLDSEDEDVVIINDDDEDDEGMHTTVLQAVFQFPYCCSVGSFCSAVSPSSAKFCLPQLHKQPAVPPYVSMLASYLAQCITDLGGTWTCQNCQSVNPPFAGDCYDCGETNAPQVGAANEPGTSTYHSAATLEQGFGIPLDQQIKIPDFAGGGVTLDACGCNFSWYCKSLCCVML